MRATAKKYITKLTATQFIVLGYLGAVLASTLLLMMPVMWNPGVKLSWMDALFTAASAVSVTGLTVVNTAETFSEFGKIALLMMFQLGGIGIMTLGAFLWLILGKNISLSYRKLIMVDQNRHQLSGLVQLMKMVLLMALIIETAGALVLGIYFRLAGIYDQWGTAFVHSIFHSISAFTNAGFDIYGYDSMDRFAHNYVVQAITIVLLILGAIGFPLLMELREFFFGKHAQFRFSLYTKLTGLMFLILVIVGTAAIWVFERNYYFANMAWHEQFFYALFNSVTTRSGGLATMDVSEFSIPTLVLLAVLMFIGASPSSAGGGIRTTTFAVILLTLYNYALGRSEVHAFRRSLKQEDITKSFVVFTASGLLIIIGSIVLGYTEHDDVSLLGIVFELCSAFGTSGLSLGITAELSTSGKWIVIAMMIMGRIGMLSLLFIFRPNRSKQLYHYPKQDIIIG